MQLSLTALLYAYRQAHSGDLGIQLRFEGRQVQQSVYSQKLTKITGQYLSRVGTFRRAHLWLYASIPA
jgi:hypothetical protein